MTNTKAFTNHKANGVYLKFPNGNTISTIWSSGSYTSNHDYEHPSGDPVKSYSERIEAGSEDVEVMISCEPMRMELIEEKFSSHSAGSGVFGHLSINEWLELLNMLAKEY